MRRSVLPSLSRGFSMVELMVAMTIGLIGVIIIFQVFETSEGVRRTTVSGGDAQQNGAIALYSLEHDLRNGGMGLSETPYAGCNIIGYDEERTVKNFPSGGNTMILAPVRIVLGANAQTPDQISIFYGSQNQIGNATTLAANMTSATSPLALQTRFGLRPGDLLLLLEPGSGKDCVFMEATGLPGTPSNQVNHDTGTYNLSAGPSVPVRFNPAGGLGVTYGGVNTANVTRVFNLGNLHDDLNFPGSQNVSLPVYNTYSIVNNSLVVQNEFAISGGVPVVNGVADNIVHLRADYGLDDGAGGTANDGIIDHYVSDVSGIPNWAQVVVSVRVAVVARSALAEKPTSGTICNTTTASPSWSGDTGGARALDLSADGNWKCYRYRVFETIVPLRNWLWKSS
jgi:type IV pilus assembly protein PilW